MAAKTYYDILGIEATATPKEVAKAYRRLALQYHPDNVDRLGLDNLGPEFKELAHERMKEINAAHDVLKNPNKRAAYDRNLTQQSQAEEARQQADDTLRRDEEWRRHHEQQRAEDERRRQAEEERRRQEAEERREQQATEERWRPEAEKQREREEVRHRRRSAITGLVLFGLIFLVAIVLILHATRPTPKFVGLTLPEAAKVAARKNFALEMSDVTYSSEPKDTIVSQAPRSHWPVAKSDKRPIVDFTISGGQGTVVVPDVSGHSVVEAGIVLAKVGLASDCLVAVNRKGKLVPPPWSGNLPVIATVPAAGSKVKAGTSVTMKTPRDN